MAQEIGFTEIWGDTFLSTIGLSSPRRVNDADALYFGVIRKPDSASIIAVMGRRRWWLFGKRRMNVAIRLADASDASWALAELDRRAPPLDTLAGYSVTVLGPTAELACGLVSRGYALDSLSTVGTLGIAMERLGVPPSVHGATIRDATPADVDYILAISRAIEHEGLAIPRGARLPHHGDLLGLLRRGSKYATLVEIDGYPVGFIAATLSEIALTGEHDPTDQREGLPEVFAGLEILILPEYRGRGLARLLYRRLFERLADLDCPVLLNGLVAHSATQRLSALMGRVPYELTAYDGAPSPPSLLVALGLHGTAHPSWNQP